MNNGVAKFKRREEAEIWTIRRYRSEKELWKNQREKNKKKNYVNLHPF
jgi:hypothetical protein